MNSITIVLFCLVFLAKQQGINAINCYSCSPGTDGCGTSFSKTGAGVIPTSNSSSTYCTKAVFASNNNAITRGYAASCTQQNYASLDTTYYLYCCTSDYCNGAPIGKTKFIFAVIPAIIGFLFIK